MADNMELARRFEEALRSNDFGKIMELLREYGTEDFIQHWPQSGERLSKAGSLRLAEVFDEQTGAEPKFTYKRMIGGGDVFVVEGTMDYGDGVPVSYVGIGEIRDGKVARMTEYFANPFEAPAWRAEYVEPASEA
jgi:hypothetical protein